MPNKILVYVDLNVKTPKVTNPLGIYCLFGGLINVLFLPFLPIQFSLMVSMLRTGWLPVSQLAC